ncbi:CheR family methyltransferase, partial [Thioclava electrotropha]|uniref:CheR family methyltransferase n=1 Tax=Thioclava electrotropha TaxID=1549850 RepID=UPI0023A88897
MTDAPEDLYVVGIGASAGGLEALRDLLEPARVDDPSAYVVVQHLDPNHESLLAELLGRSTSLEVLQAEDGAKLEAGHVYTIPPGYGLEVENGRLKLSEFAQPRGLRRPIDDFFVSLGQDLGRRAVCVILSGTGTDGSVGLRAVKEHGGFCIAQDATARYDSMPNSAVATGMVDVVSAPSDVIARITEFRNVDPDQVNTAPPVSGTLDEICAALNRLTGHDFAQYKRSTLERRIQRRMQVVGILHPREYLERLEREEDEPLALLGDLLINVTRFFRDSAHFEALNETAIKPMVEKADDGGALRIWVPGCSSGEEAYTLAMLIDRAIHASGKEIDFQIFATDIDERMLAIAREGRYPVSVLLDLPERYRDLYTIGREGNFQITAALRDRVRFSPHSLIKDPPFSRLDLVSCRNLLIYFGEKLQARALPIFHYALNPGGVLFLGPSETIGRHEELFDPIDGAMRIFRSIGPRSPYPTELPMRSDPHARLAPLRPKTTDRRTKDWNTTLASNRILDLYAPATLNVDRDGAILAATGRLGKYLEIDPSETGQGYAQSLARAGLREALSAVIRESAELGTRKIVRDVEVISETGRQRVDVLADPLSDDTLLIVFRDRGPFEALDEYDFDEIAPPFPPRRLRPRRLRGRIVLTPRLECGTTFALDPEGRHKWWPVAPAARVRVESNVLAGGGWEGSGYHDLNWGTRPLETDFRGWDWSRGQTPDGGAMVLYDARLRDGTRRNLALRFTGDGTPPAAFDVPERKPLKRGWWGVEGGIACDTDSQPRILRAPPPRQGCALRRCALA